MNGGRKKEGWRGGTELQGAREVGSYHNVASEVALTTTSDAGHDDKIGITTTCVFVDTNSHRKKLAGLRPPAIQTAVY